MIVGLVVCFIKLGLRLCFVNGFIVVIDLWFD